MKKTLFILLFGSLGFFVQAQELAFNNKKFKLDDYSLITSVHWRQLPMAGQAPVTLTTPDSLTTKILNLNRAGIYRFELAITFFKNGVTTVARDTVTVTAKPPVKDSVSIVDRFSTSESIRVISTVQSTMRIQVYSGTTLKQSYSATAYAGVRILFVTGVCDTCTVRITLNGKVYNL